MDSFKPEVVLFLATEWHLIGWCQHWSPTIPEPWEGCRRPSWPQDSGWRWQPSDWQSSGRWRTSFCPRWSWGPRTTGQSCPWQYDKSQQRKYFGEHTHPWVAACLSITSRLKLKYSGMLHLNVLETSSYWKSLPLERSLSLDLRHKCINLIH